MSEDLEQLKLLSLFHYVVAGITALFGCLPIGHLVIGIAALTGDLPMKGDDGFLRVLFGALFAGVGAFAIAICWTLAGCMLVAGRRLKAHRNRTFCTVIACFETIFMPFGTALGVFTLIVLQRPSVRELFDRPQDPGESDPWQTPELSR